MQIQRCGAVEAQAKGRGRYCNPLSSLCLMMVFISLHHEVRKVILVTLMAESDVFTHIPLI